MNKLPQAGLIPSEKMPPDPVVLLGLSQRRPWEVVTGLDRIL